MEIVLTATGSLSAAVAPVMHAYLELTLRRGHMVVGSELAEALGQPVDLVNRQLNRGKATMVSALVPLGPRPSCRRVWCGWHRGRRPVARQIFEAMWHCDAASAPAPRDEPSPHTPSR